MSELTEAVRAMDRRIERALKDADESFAPGTPVNQYLIGYHTGFRNRHMQNWGDNNNSLFDWGRRDGVAALAKMILDAAE